MLDLCGQILDYFDEMGWHFDDAGDHPDMLFSNGDISMAEFAKIFDVPLVDHAALRKLEQEILGDDSRRINGAS